MLPFEDRYSRQRKLPEVGAEGQRRIEGLSARVASGPGGLVELAYLERAGVGQVEISVPRPGAPQASAPPFPHANIFRCAAARDIAAGAWRAQQALLGALPAARPARSAAKSEIGTP